VGELTSLSACHVRRTIAGRQGSFTNVGAVLGIAQINW